MNSSQIAQSLLEEFDGEVKTLEGKLAFREHQRLLQLTYLKMIVDQCCSEKPDVETILKTALRAVNELEA